MAYKDRDEFLDKLYDHVFGDGDPSDEDKEFFEHLATFFPEEGGSGNEGQTHRRRAGQSGGQSGGGSRRVAPPPRRRSRASAGSGGYGSSLWFGPSE